MRISDWSSDVCSSDPLDGCALVVLFMLALYRTWGLIANLALSLNVALTLGALSMLGATLTLPGIAGIILGIGMAVDANILINERIREEIGRASCRERVCRTCRSRWSPYH